VIALALRTLVRYVVPFAIATALVGGPALALAFRAPWPRNLPTANAALLRAWLLAATGWLCVLVLVGAAAPLARSLAGGAPLSQPRAVAAALANLARMLLPCLAAAGAVAIGGLTLVAPALLVLVLLSLTGASTERGMSAPLADSAAAVRAHWRPVAAIVGAMLALHVGIAVAAWKLATVPVAPKLAPAQWATYGNVARIVAIGIVVTAPIFAALLAAARVRR
jgi:hypothetical protein